MHLLNSLKSMPYLLPVFSALLGIFAMPPLQISTLLLVIYVPMYLFAVSRTKVWQGFVGGLIYGVFFAGVVAHAVMSGFNWLPEATLFIAYMKMLGWVIVLINGLVGGVVFASITYIALRTKNHMLLAIFSVLILLAYEYIIVLAAFGYHYGSLGYIATEFERLRIFAEYGGSYAVATFVILINILVAEVVRAMRTGTFTFVAQLALVCVFMQIAAYSLQAPLAPQVGHVRVAVIQEQSRGLDAFGVVENGVFSFPSLEAHVQDALIEKPDILIYPIAPWSGVLSDEVDNTRFDREVIVISDAMLSAWLKKHVTPDVVFVFWYTTYRDGDYLNEMTFWQDGEQIEGYQKRKIFPFFDYVPEWAQSLGMYSLPYDGTAGTDASPSVVGDARVGSLVCSEVVDRKTAQENSQTANMLFAIGSEALFSHKLPSEYNNLNAQLRAAELGLPVVRANRSGPSAVFDADGSVIASMPYGVSGVFVAEVPVYDGRHKTFYEQFILQ